MPHPDTDATLTVAQGAAPLGDPHICSDFRDRRAVLLALFESLVRRAPDGSYAPALAERWSASEDARVWRFELRPGARCHDGGPLDASDAAASLERVCDPALGGEWGTQGVYLSYLEGARFTPLGPTALEVALPEPLADLLDLLVDMPIVPARAHAALPGAPVGSGPYRLAEAAPGRLTLEAFDGGGRRPRYGRLVFLAEPDPAARAALLASGRADVAADLAPAGAAALEAQGFGVRRALSGLCVIAMLSAGAGPCADPRVRRALNHAADVPALMRAAGVEAEPLSGPLTRLHLAFDPETPPYARDLALARRLLAEAGHAGGLRLTLHRPTSHPDESEALAAGLAAQWAEAGVALEVVAHEDRPGYAEMVRAKQIGDACLFDSSPLSSFRVLAEKIHSGRRGPWWQGYASPEADALIDQARATADDGRRRAIYRRAFRLIRDDAPWLFLYSPTLRHAVGPRAAWWSPGADGLLSF